MRNYIQFRHWNVQPLADGVPVEEHIEIVGDDDDECQEFVDALLRHRSTSFVTYTQGATEKSDKFMILDKRYLLNILKFATWYGFDRMIAGWTNPTLIGFGPRIEACPIIPIIREKSPRDTWSHGH